MKKIYTMNDKPQKIKYAERGIVLCDNLALFRQATNLSPLQIGASLANDIQIAKDQPLDGGSIDSHLFMMHKEITIRCNQHRAIVRIPQNIGHNVNFPLLQEWSKEPILSIFPVVYVAMLLWQKAYAKTDLSTDDVAVNCDDFDGILPIVVAAAMRGTPIMSYRLPKEGIQQSICENLAVDMHVKEN